jgi:hypothetical protein
LLEKGTAPWRNCDRHLSCGKAYTKPITLAWAAALTWRPL